MGGARLSKKVWVSWTEEVSMSATVEVPDDSASDPDELVLALHGEIGKLDYSKDVQTDAVLDRYIDEWEVQE